MAEDEDSSLTQKKAGQTTHAPIPPRLSKKLGKKSSRTTKVWLGSVLAIFVLWTGLFLSVLGDGGGGPSSEGPDVIIHGIIFEDGGWEPAVITETINGSLLVAGTTYVFRIYSDDTPHGFGIPVLGIETDVILQGQYSDLQISFPSAGNYTFICNIFCSAEHDEMIGTIIVT